MAEFGTRPTKFLRMPDGTEIRIRVDGDQAYIHLSGVSGGGGYQFIGSLARLYKTFNDDNYPTFGTRYLPLVYATSVNYKNGKWVATPLVSSAEEAAEGITPSWTYDPDPRKTNYYLPISPMHQPDGAGMRWTFITTADNPESSIPWLATQWQQPLPLSAFGRYSGAKQAYHIVNDMGYDYGPTLFEGNGLKGVNKTADADWYGQAAVHVVGGRMFIIMVDVNSVFYCYPTTGYGSELIPGGGEWAGERANVPLELTKSQACPFPAWVSNELLGVAAIQAGVSNEEHMGRLRTLWCFNQAGTRAACVVAHRDDPWSDAYYTSSRYSNSGSHLYDCREDYPGMVEVEFTVTVTGEGDKDFDFSVALRQNIYSKTDKKCPVAVGYAIKDMGGVARESLIMLDHQFYTDNPAMVIDPAAAGWLYRLQRQNIAVVSSVQAQLPDAEEWLEVRRWLAYYVCYPSADVGFGYGYPGMPQPKYSPTIKDLPGVEQDWDFRGSFFSYTGKLVSLDLSSLAWCVAACIEEYGDLGYFEGAVLKTKRYGAEAVTIVTSVFGSEKSRVSLGHPSLKQASSDMFDLVHGYPEITNMTRLYLGATAGYAEYATEDTDNAILTVTDGDGGEWTHAIEAAYEDIDRFYSIQGNATLFPAAITVKSPGIFAYFDNNIPVIRPGYLWWDGSGQQPGGVAFSGYPYIAILNARVNFLILSPLNATYSAIKTHVNGSWSLFAGPFAAITETQRLSEAVPENYEQSIIDRIVLVDKRGNENTTTHIAMLNKAFSKDLTVEDYYFDIRASDPETSTGLQVRPASDDPTEQGYFDIMFPGSLGIGWTYEDIGYFAKGLIPLRGRTVANFSIGSNFMFIYPYATYSQMGTFPSPRMECVFHPGEL